MGDEGAAEGGSPMDLAAAPAEEEAGGAMATDEGGAGAGEEFGEEGEAAKKCGACAGTLQPLLRS